ncbi:hypothetical protein F2Q69_00014366 [Brassica cretica]|uniref:Uncharacterized protein n=1 Tax=Brassica cretica TaxID=69181 RepID=A0A8S9QYI6_BRACR|nr:hypothetical protein F2Q69_00014366 [Brassica cretica]
MVDRGSWLQRLGLVKLCVFGVNLLEQRCGQANFYQGVVSYVIKGFNSCGAMLLVPSFGSSSTSKPFV